MKRRVLNLYRVTIVKPKIGRRQRMAIRDFNVIAETPFEASDAAVTLGYGETLFKRHGCSVGCSLVGVVSFPYVHAL